MAQASETAFLKLQTLQSRDLKALASVTADHCVSIITPTHRTGREMTQDPIRLKNLLDTVTAQLQEVGANESILDPIHQATRDTRFWQHQGDGLAIYATPDDCRMFRLNRKPQEHVLVAGQFLLTPIIKQQSASGKFFVLSLTWDEAKLMHGDAESLTLVETDHLPATFHDLVLPRDPEENLQNTSHRSVGNTGSTSTAMFHGHGEGEGKIEADRDKYLSLVGEQVASAIYNTGTPLAIVATAEVAGHFESTTSVDVDVKIDGSPSQWREAELKSQIAEPLATFRKDNPDTLKERFGTALSQGKASGDLVDISRAAEENRIETLMIRRDSAGGQETNSAVIATILSGGDVLLCEPESMPREDDEIASLFRF